MSVDEATVTPAVGGSLLDGDERKPNDPYRFLSTRLVRELIGADLRAEAEEESAPETATRLLRGVVDGLQQAAGALLGAGDLASLAACGFEAEELALLKTHKAHAEAVPLARRAVAERRALLLGPGSREPLLPALREIRSDRSSLALVPLLDRDRSIAVLALASTDAAPLTPAFLRSLAPAFRLLALLLNPLRSLAAAGGGEDAGRLAPEVESYLVEIEELRSRLGEARDVARQLENQESSSQAAQRAEIESLRARVSELEATALAGGTESFRREEVEAECARREQEIIAREQRIVVLEEELRAVTDRLQEAEESLLRARQRESAPPLAEAALREAIAATNGDDGGEGEPATTLPGLDADDLRLGEIAAAAAASLEETNDSSTTVELDLGEIEEVGRVDSRNGEAIEAPGDVELDGAFVASASGDGSTEDDGAASEPEVVLDVPAESDAGAGASLALWLLDADPRAHAWASELAERSGATYWTGDGEPPRSRRRLLAMNLFDPCVERAFELAGEDAALDAVVYAADPESGTGFELGAVDWLRRPLEPESILSRIQKRVGRRLGGIIIVSAQLRELAGLRQALAEADAAGSVACDARQAADLLEIVRRPDAVLIDLALEGGQGFALARQLRRQPETCDVPLLFLLPERIDAEIVRAAAERARVLEPYGFEDARRLVNGALARGH